VVHLSPIFCVLQVSEFLVSRHFPPESVKPAGQLSVTPGGMGLTSFLHSTLSDCSPPHLFSPLSPVPLFSEVKSL